VDIDQVAYVRHEQPRIKDIVADGIAFLAGGNALCRHRVCQPHQPIKSVQACPDVLHGRVTCPNMASLLLPRQIKAPARGHL